MHITFLCYLHHYTFHQPHKPHNKIRLLQGLGKLTLLVSVHINQGKSWYSKSTCNIVVLTAVIMKITIFWDVTLCSLVGIYQHFRVTCCLFIRIEELARIGRTVSWLLSMLCHSVPPLPILCHHLQTPLVLPIPVYWLLSSSCLSAWNSVTLPKQMCVNFYIFYFYFIDIFWFWLNTQK